jgi:hypothetical protein
MTKAEKAMLSGVDPVMKDQAVTVCRIERAFRAKVKELIPIFKEAEATQTVTNTQGEKVLKSNPAMQEIRATFRDYCTIVKVQQDILASKTAPVEMTSISALRSKLRAKVAIEGDKEKGKIVISYFSKDDLLNICDVILAMEE